MKPARGVSFFRKIEAHDMIGSIVVPAQTVEKLVALQGEIVSVGDAEWCDDPDCRRPHDTETAKGSRKALRTHRKGPGIVPGGWVLLSPRSWVETGILGILATTTDSILGVYAVSVTKNSKTPSAANGAYSG